MQLNSPSQRKTLQMPQKLQIGQLLLNQKFKSPIPIPNSSQVSPVGSDANLKDFRALHSHKGSQIDVTSLTKLIKQSKSPTNEATKNSTQQIQVLLQKAKDITGQFKATKSQSHSRKESSNELKFKSENKQVPFLDNYSTLKELLSSKLTPKNTSTDNQLGRNIFNFEFVIGIGGFGKVWKVEHKKTYQKYAMKEMSKALIITKKSVNSVMNERTLLSSLKHTLIVNMYYAFQDRENLYLVMDYMRGGDLRYHIGKMRRFSEDQTKFFIACIFLGLEYIHSNNIIHRDIKPENLVLDESGYAHITDFGIARVMKSENSTDTSGTPGYMAPEVMYRQNHSFSVDYYALGVIAYEFMLGRRPYIGRSRQEIRDQIISKQVQIRRQEIPEGWSLEGADFVNRLIQRKPQNRLGNGGSHEIKEHPWFAHYPWDQLLQHQLKPPYFPNQTEDNFDQKQIIIEDEENNELIQQNIMILRDPNTQDLFSGYEYSGTLQNQSTSDSNSSAKNSNNYHSLVNRQKSQNQQIRKNEKNIFFDS